MSNRSKFRAIIEERNQRDHHKIVGIVKDPGKLDVPDTWVEFAKVCKIRSGDGIVHFVPYPYQERLVEQIEGHITTVVAKTRQLGLTETCINYALWRALKDPGFLCVAFSKTQQDTSSLAKRLRKTLEFLHQYGEPVTDSLTDISFPNGSRLLFRNSTANGARGIESVHMLLFDEAAFVDGIEDIYKSAIPCTTMVGDKAKVIILSTPNGQTGWYYNQLADGNDNHDFLAICEGIRNNKVPPTQYWTDSKGICKFVTHWYDHPKFGKQKETYLETLKDRFGLTQEIVEQEYNLNFTDAATSVFSAELIRLTTVGEWEREPDPNASYYIGIDTSLMGADYTVATVLKSIGDKLYLVDLYRKRKLTNELQIHNLSLLLQKYQPVAVGIEVNSGGIIYYEQLIKINPNVNIDQIKTTGVSKPVMINKLLLAMERNVLILPPDRTIIEELLSFRQLENKLEAQAGGHDDIIMSLAFALTATRGIFG